MDVNVIDVFGGGKKRKFKFKAIQLSSCIISVIAPVCNAANSGHNDKHVKEQLLNSDLSADDVVAKAFDNARKKYSKAVPKGKDIMQYLLVFPDSVNLSSSALNIHEKREEERRGTKDVRAANQGWA